jgi:D-hydroxyproline dehydrogenase subunit alpha
LTNHEFDVLVVGAGPAGIAAACAAAACGTSVGVVDENFAPGGQIWRGETRPEIVQLQQANATVFQGAAVFDAPEPGLLLSNSGEAMLALRYKALVLATGARERWIPFPGWDLPGVFGAGGLQALAKSGWDIQGKRVVVAGTGPLLLAAADYFRKCGAVVALIAEQAPWRDLARFALGLMAHPGKASEAVQLRWGLRQVEYAASCWPTHARGDDQLRSVVLREEGRDREVACDLLACGFGLMPNTELGMLLGCEAFEGALAVNEEQQCSVEGLYAAGEVTGIGGTDLAQLEGSIAGFHAAREPGQARALYPRRASARRFAENLARTFALRPELRSLPADDTIICRCEDVTWGRLRTCANWRHAKLQTRCGMGPCQARVCGPALDYLQAWPPEKPRPPLVPVPVERMLERGEST